jgi:hypothetical protein
MRSLRGSNPHCKPDVVSAAISLGGSPMCSDSNGFSALYGGRAPRRASAATGASPSHSVSRLPSDQFQREFRNNCAQEVN